jgi:hypothetical protein
MRKSRHGVCACHATTPPAISLMRVHHDDAWTEKRLFAMIIGIGARCAVFAEPIVRHRRSAALVSETGRMVDE